jgi:YjbE family integral membrane protein
MGSLVDPSTWASVISHGLSEIGHAAFWLALLKIIWIDILLSGDNAVVIAMACRRLPPRQRLWGMVLGAGAAVLMRTLFTVVIAVLMTLPYLKIVGGIALLYIAVKLLLPEEEKAGDGDAEASDRLWRAIRLIVVADIVMSLDNVIAIAAAAGGNVVLLMLGLAISIPLIVAGAALIMSLLDRLPILIWAGAALLGWIAGEVIATDPAVHAYRAGFDSGVSHAIVIASGVVGALLVMAVGALIRRSRHASQTETEKVAAE